MTSSARSETQSTHRGRITRGKIPTDMDVRGIAQDILFPPRTHIPAEQVIRDAKDATNTGNQEQAIPLEASARYEAVLKAENYPVTPANLKALYDQDQKAVAK